MFGGIGSSAAAEAGSHGSDGHSLDHAFMPPDSYDFIVLCAFVQKFFCLMIASVPFPGLVCWGAVGLCHDATWLLHAKVLSLLLPVHFHFPFFAIRQLHTLVHRCFDYCCALDFLTFEDFETHSYNVEHFR